MALDFQKFATQGNEFINHFAEELKIPNDKEKAGRILRAVLHAIRNRISTEESVQFLAQLPMFLKAVYVESWTLKNHNRIKHLKDFFEEVRKEDGLCGSSDFKTDEDVEMAIKSIFVSLRKYVSDGELEDIASELPKELKSLVLQRVIVEKTNPATSI